MIKCLPVEIQGKLRSGVAIPSLQQCVEELVLNSIDAGATCVGVRVDMEALKVQVIDNGSGMTAEDMGRVGNIYFTSKCSSIEDLENLRWYGFRGEALASIVSLSTLVEISSRARSSGKTHTKLFKDGKTMEVFEAETARPSAGTTVIICGFFHNMPVRRKRMDALLEGERIRQRVEAISLMHPSVSFTLKNDCTGAMTVQLPKAKNTYHRFLQMHGLGRAQKLGEISHAHAQFEVIGHIGREGHYNNSLQFLYVNDRLLLKTRIHKLLNFLLRRLSSPSKKNDSPDGHTATRSPKQKRSQEQHGVYIINIKCSYSEYDICLEPAKTLIEFRDWDGILLCVEEAVKAFLSKENLVAELSQDDSDYLSPNLLRTHDIDQEGHSGNGGQETSKTSTLDCGIGMKLASSSVHRKHKGDIIPEVTVCLESREAEFGEESEEIGQEKGYEDEAKVVKEERNEVFGDEPPHDEEKIGPALYSDITEEEELMFSEAGEGSDVSHISSPNRREERENLHKDPHLSTGPSESNETPQQGQPDSNRTKGISADCQGKEGHGQNFASNRKIRVCDPYIHESLQTQDMLHANKPIFQQQNPMLKCEAASFVGKRKVSLNADERLFQKQYSSTSLSKIPKIESCKKLSLCKEPGSLEKFRRAYCKSAEPKLPAQETQQVQHFRLPETNSLVSECQEGRVDGGATETEQLTASAFTILKPALEENKSKKSLASKLCQLKHHRTDASKELPATASQDDSNGVKYDSNDQNHCDKTPEPTSGCSTDPQPTEEEDDTTSGDWLHHYDASIGKTVFINKVTGLSRYEDPQTEETQVRCTSDITNMAVSVISETGMEFRCYPFQGDLVLPFLPKSRTERVISAGLDDKGDDGETSNSLTSLYSKWTNPVFIRPPQVGVDISSREADGLAVKVHNILFSYRFSKDMIHSMKVIHQVDKKFLACLINTREGEQSASHETKENLLVLVDQHAAHERVRLENLVADSYEDDPDTPGERRLCSSTILPPLGISVTEEELRLLRSRQPHLRNLGLDMNFSEGTDPQVFVGKVPLCFLEKESNELRRGRPSVIKPIVEEYLREQIELLCSTGRVKGTLPLTVLKVLASLACHGAIKFNDSLSRDECCSLVASLSSCQLPFQCAHGRPSLAPLVDILHLDKDQKELQKPNLRKLRRMYKAWQLYGDK